MNTAWLAIDTATDVASVVVAHPTAGAGGRTASAVLGGARRQAAELLPTVDRVLRAADTSLDQLAGLVVGDGPGSFTGLRIGWALAKGLAQEREIPLYTAASLAGLAWVAWRACGLGPTATVAACYDALRGEVYGAVYEISGAHLTALVHPRVLRLPELVRLAPTRPAAAIGDGAERYAAEIRAWTGRAPLERAEDRDADATVAHGLAALTAYPGVVRRIDDLRTAEPAYGRPAAAQTQWEARHGRPLPDPSRPLG
jgi:tRNA threonylcarbamoyl adenosine modification protein YeaZ